MDGGGEWAIKDKKNPKKMKQKKSSLAPRKPNAGLQRGQPNNSTSFADAAAAEIEQAVAAAARVESSAPPLSSRRPAAKERSRRTSR